MQRRDLAGVLVDADDVVAEIGKAGARNEADIAGADHRDAHRGAETWLTIPAHAAGWRRLSRAAGWRDVEARRFIAIGVNERLKPRARDDNAARRHGYHEGRMNASHCAAAIDWVDYAKGFCIVMVVMMHSTLGVEQAAGREGWMHALVAFAKPFRMPDFFLISGLFLARVIDRDWRDYLDRKVVHFAYFYVLWVTIQFAFKAPMFAAEHRLARRRPAPISKPSSSRSARCGSSICCRSSSSSMKLTRGVPLAGDLARRRRARDRATSTPAGP